MAAGDVDSERSRRGIDWLIATQTQQGDVERGALHGDRLPARVLSCATTAIRSSSRFGRWRAIATCAPATAGGRLRNVGRWIPSFSSSRACGRKRGRRGARESAPLCSGGDSDRLRSLLAHARSRRRSGASSASASPGGLDPALAPGDILVGTAVSHGERRHCAKNDLSDALMANCEAPSRRRRHGRVRRQRRGDHPHRGQGGAARRGPARRPSTWNRMSWRNGRTRMTCRSRSCACQRSGASRAAAAGGAGADAERPGRHRPGR